MLVKLFSRLIIALLSILLPNSVYATDMVTVTRLNKDTFALANCVFIIDSEVDLNGCEVILKENCILKFRKNGRLINGSIVGNNTKIKGLRESCLGIDIKGTWILEIIKDEVFDSGKLSDNQILDNIFYLQSDDLNNRILLTKRNYNIVFTSSHRHALRLKNNAILKMNTTLYVCGNSLPHYAAIVTANNNKILGGSIVGDVEHHELISGSTSEWGFGIYVNKSENVSIRNTRISRCTGDGIYIGGGNMSAVGEYTDASKNIIIKGVVSDNNRRQGISITCADGVYVEDSVFSNTGNIGYTGPGCGLDIEPNVGQSVRNVTLRKCQFLNNKGESDLTICNYYIEGTRCSVERIQLENCRVTGQVLITTGSVLMRRCSMGTLRIHLAMMPQEKVLLERCKIEGGSGVVIRSLAKTTDNEFAPRYTFKSCVIRMDEALTGGMFSMMNHKGNQSCVSK